MRKPKVTVGLPVYNGEKYLVESLESVLAQSYEDIEVIISDNQSSDSTEEICRTYENRDPRVRYFRQSENQGAAFNHCVVFQKARGKYFRWQAHDDVCAPDLISVCVREFETSNVPYSLVYTGARLIDGAGNPIGEDSTDISCDESRPMARAIRCMRGLHLGTPMYGLMPTETLARTRLIEAFVSSDHVLFFELAYLGCIRKLPGLLYRKRIHDKRSMSLPVSEQYAWAGGKQAVPKELSAVRKRRRKEFYASLGNVNANPFSTAYARSMLFCHFAYQWILRRIRSNPTAKTSDDRIQSLHRPNSA